jgi:hypothetical protein
LGDGGEGLDEGGGGEGEDEGGGGQVGGGDGAGGGGEGDGGGGDGETHALHSRTSWTSWATELISACCASNFAWNSTRRAEIASEHPQVGVGDALTLPSIQKTARDLSSRRVPCILVGGAFLRFERSLRPGVQFSLVGGAEFFWGEASSRSGVPLG